jgi:hypothetical protein
MTTRTSEPGDEQRAFLQQRVALFGKVMFIIVLLGGCAYVGLIPREHLFKPWFALYLVNAGLLTSAWLTCRTGVRSVGFCRGVEAVVLLASAAVGAVTIRFLAKEASDRPQSASELLERVHSCASWGEWSEGKARVWWRENDERLRDLHREEVGSAHSMSVVVDLDRREPMDSFPVRLPQPRRS